MYWTADFNFTLVVLESDILQDPIFGKSDSSDTLCRCWCLRAYKDVCEVATKTVKCEKKQTLFTLIRNVIYINLKFHIARREVVYFGGWFAF